jgi:hypothetical protein
MEEHMSTDKPLKLKSKASQIYFPFAVTAEDSSDVEFLNKLYTWFTNNQKHKPVMEKISDTEYKFVLEGIPDPADAVATLFSGNS